MTSVYFVRHAQPCYGWPDDRTRPLSVEGKKDCEKVWKALDNVKIDFAYSSPYLRSVETIRECAKRHCLKISTDERFRERESGEDANCFELFRERWKNFDFHEEMGESLNMVQKRNTEALFKLLEVHCDQNIMLGTHGTALSCILNYFDKDYNVDSFLRIIDFMPYIIKMEFEGFKPISMEEVLIVKKEYKK